MSEKYGKGSKERSALAGQDVSHFPKIDCDSQYSASALELQAEIYEKFAPKRRRAESVAGLYGAVGERFWPSLSPEAPDWVAPGWEAPAHPVEEYWKLVGEKRCVDTVYRLMSRYPPDRLLTEVSRLCSDWYVAHSGQVRDCGTLLEFRVAPERAALHHANFCRDRLCPLCNWRRSLKIFGQVSKVMNVLDAEKYRYLFLTLTVRNVWGDELSEAVQALYDGWFKLYNRYMSGKGAQARTSEKRLKGIVKGTFRALEVTVSNGEKSPGWEGSFHPHLHVILAVDPAYFKRGHYLTTGEWSDIWRKACNLAYSPSVKIEAVRPKPLEDCAFDALSDCKAASAEAGETISYAGAVAELSKYPMKDADYNCDADYGQEKGQYLSWVIHALRARRLVGMTGRFKEVFHELSLDDPEDGDLVHVGPDELRLDLNYLVVKCHWRCGAYERFVYRPEANEGVGTGVALKEAWHEGDVGALRRAETEEENKWERWRGAAARRRAEKQWRAQLEAGEKGGGDDGATA